MANMNMGPGPRASGGPQSAGRPGQMTAVMRAMATATGPKVLRIGLVQSGRVVEERIIKQRTTVTVGSNERATFVIGKDHTIIATLSSKDDGLAPDEHVKKSLEIVQKLRSK